MYDQFNITFCAGHGEKFFVGFFFGWFFFFCLASIVGHKLFPETIFCHTDKYCVFVTVLPYLYFHSHVVFYFCKSFSIRTLLCLHNRQLVNLLVHY